MRLIASSLILSIALPVSVAADEIAPDPLADGQITCDEMQAFSHLVFTPYIDLGSGKDSPTKVDYQCDKGVSRLPYLENLLSLAESIRQEDILRECGGTLAYAQWRYYKFNLLMAGIAPKQFHKMPPTLLHPSLTDAYLHSWALHNPENYKLEQSFLKARSDVRPLLISYYQGSHGTSRSEAEELTDKLLALISHRAAGSFAGSSDRAEKDQETPPHPLISAVEDETPNISMIKQALAQSPPANVLDKALKTAILHDLPETLIAELIAAMDNPDLGDESAIFFALNKPNVLELLLRKGAEIDYSNSFGKTLLFYAIESSSHSRVEMLLHQGANPNHAYKNQKELESLRCITHNIKHSSRTPLMHAAQHSDSAMLALLLRNGATLDAKDGMGWNALDYAQANQRHENIEYLLSLGLTPAVDQY